MCAEEVKGKNLYCLLDPMYIMFDVLAASQHCEERKENSLSNTIFKF